MAKLSTLIDAFTASSINTSLWNNITAGTATLDTVNDLVTLAVPTVNGTTNTFGTTLTFDATSSSIYAQITAPANGAGGTKVAFKIQLDANNSVALRVESGVFKTTLQTAGTTVTTTLPTYDPHAHRWWRIRETGGSWAADTAPDGYTWTTLWTSSYSWSATAVSFLFQTGASVTEVSGSVAAIQNVNSMLGGQFNPNWPLVDDGWSAYWNANGGTMPLDRYVDVTNRTRGSVNISRGCQYELDQVRSGEASLTLANTDGVLDPLNATGPYYGHIQPYQPYKRRAQWPPTRNLLTQVQATGGDLGGLSTGTINQSASGPNIFSLSDSSGGSIVASTTAWQGSTVLQFSVPNATATQTAIGFTRQPPVEPNATYTVQLRVRNVTASTSLQAEAFIVFADVAGTTTTLRSSAVTLTGSTTAAWTLVTVSGTAPANTARASCGVETAATAAATCSVQVDGWQWERGGTASAWTAPGVVYPVYAGWTERWTPSWNMAGTYGIVAPTAVDTFSLLSQQTLSDPLTQEINSRVPRFVYKLDDPSGSVSATDWTGNFPPAQLGVSKYGAGSWTWGTAITSTDAGGTYTGSSGSVATLNNPNPGSTILSAATFLRLTTAGIKGPADPTAWVRMIAFRYTGPTITSGAYLWSCMDSQRSGGSPSGSHIYVYLDTAGKPNVWIQGPTGAGTAYAFGGATNCVDGDWHLLLFGYNQSTQQVLASQDGAVAAFYGSVPTTYTPTGLIADNVGTFVDATVGNGTILNFKGDISFVAEFGWSFVSSANIANMYTAWKSACAGESTDARYARILSYAGYSGVSSLQAGLTTSMGPAAFDGQDAMSALQAVVDSENGAHFIDRAGAVQFKARSNRYNALTPTYIFGENASAGEYPYEDIALDYDSTHLSNQVTVTQESSGQNFYATDATSIANYFPRTLTRSINSSSSAECQDAADYLLSRYKASAMRVSSLKLHPSANPSLWPVVLNLELGTRVRVMRRPPGAAVVQVDCFVENITADFGDDGECFYTLQCSPADLTPYAIFTAWYAAVTFTMAAGVNSMTISNRRDSTNLLAAQVTAGQQLVIGLGTANAETVTVASVGATSPGWTSATITFTTNTVNSHSANETISEPMPTGVTDPTNYDVSAVFDSAAFAY